MCGIAGIYSYRQDIHVNPHIAIKMRDMLVHRGPDDEGLYLSPDKRLCLVHTRLSIIDLSSSGHQPMANREGTVWISYNGEIYNYYQLQGELKGKGYDFKSNTDTEVIIHGYEEWGIDGLLQKLRGMFAFAIYDSRYHSGYGTHTPKLFLVRDRLGIKPLYYFQDNDLLIFASEVKALSKNGLVAMEKNKESDIAFLIFGHIPEPLTTVKKVFSMPAGTYMAIQDRETKLVRYYDLSDSFIKPKINHGKNIYHDLQAILSETVRIHLISDAPLGVFLSGGIDSSALVALANRVSVERCGSKNGLLTTLSIVFEEEKYSETQYQKIVAERYKTDHREIKVTRKDFYDAMDKIFDAMDQPTVDGVNTYFVSRAAKQAGLKTVLSGTGGDEVFCGYESFKRISSLRRLQSLSKLLRWPFAMARSLNDRWRKLSYLQNDDPLSLYLTLRALFIPEDVARLLSVSVREVHDVIESFKREDQDLHLKDFDGIEWLSYMEMAFYLQNQLLKDTDFMSMYHSVETRVPFLDHVLVDCIASVSSSMKIDGSIPKPLLVKSLNHCHQPINSHARESNITGTSVPDDPMNMLPDEIVFRKKQGFAFPFDIWIKKHGEDLLEDALARGHLNKKFAKRIWRKFELDHVHWSRVWSLIMLEKYNSIRC